MSTKIYILARVLIYKKCILVGRLSGEIIARQRNQTAIYITLQLNAEIISMHRLDLTGKPLSLNRGDIRDTMQTIRTSFSTSCGQVTVCTVQSGKHRSDKLPHSYIIEFLLKIETVTVICTATAHRYNFLYHDARLLE